MLERGVDDLPWAEQLAADDGRYRAQLAYLFERSAFYRAKLGEAGVESAEEAGGLAEIGRLPLTGKPELRATCTPDNPIGSCMVSSEGACAAHYTYGRFRDAAIVAAKPEPASVSAT